MKFIPNSISFCRIILSLLMFFVKPLSAAFYGIYLLCGLSDVLDGFIARKTGTTSRFGAKIDSFADFIMVGVFIVVLFPIVNPPSTIVIWIIFIGLIKVASMAVILKKYQTFAILHTYGNKLTGLLLFLFPMMLPFSDPTVLMAIICVVASLTAIEELMINLISKELQLDKPSIFVK